MRPLAGLLVPSVLCGAVKELMIMTEKMTKHKLQQLVTDKLTVQLGAVDIANAPVESFYQAVVLVIKDLLDARRNKFWAHNLAEGKKQVYYLSMEFLLGKSLKNSLYNLDIVEQAEQALAEYGIKLEQLYAWEPDAGLGNGGLGRLAACYLDGLAHEEYLATGYCILYEFGMFKQRIIDGWQTEKPDQWLPGGEVWLQGKPGYEVEVKFGGHVKEYFEDGHHIVSYENYQSVMAVPYDINIPGYNSQGVSMLRVWRAKNSIGMDMDSFNRGDYASAFQQTSFGEAISKVLYPNDNHAEGKNLRLRQQYFLCAASISDICRRHLGVYGTLENFAEKTAIHINDTHPTLAIPELMRFLLDDCGFHWEEAWGIVTKTFAYTNHTVMAEAMECWDESLLRHLLPRIYSIVCEINRRFCDDLITKYGLHREVVDKMSIVQNHQIRMANLAVVGSHSVNGVSRLHSQILKNSVFRDFYVLSPHKFTNVTNGIASRRWLLQSNPSLTRLIQESIGENFADNMQNLSKLEAFSTDTAFLDRLAASKRENKARLCKYVQSKTGVVLDPDSIFDTQAKRLHEYKRQQLNVLDILATCHYLRDHPNAPFTPRTYLFGAKAAPGYYMAKQIIKLIYDLSVKIERDPVMRKKIRVVFLEEYNVTLSELLMPASDISEQISLAGTEASGTGNMKLMLSGAITLGTLDGANVEIEEAVGPENILIFGMSASEAERTRSQGYSPIEIYEGNPLVRQVVDALVGDFDNEGFPDLQNSLKYSDTYMTLADFDSYRQARTLSQTLYNDTYRWQRMALSNIAHSGVFCADRAVGEYAKNIWGLRR